MPQVEFLQDFQGKETREVFYKKGQVVDLPENMLDILLREKRVKIIAGSLADVTPQMDEGVHYGIQAEPEQIIHTKNRKRR